MKLRLRSLESKETQKIEVPNSCSLQQLKETLSRVISSPPSSLHLSLNRKDEIYASSLEESLHSVGIASGDLIFYTLNPNAFSLETLVHKPEVSQIEPTNPILQETLSQHLTAGQTEVSEIDMTDALLEAEKPVILNAGERGEEGLSGAESMDIIDGSVEVMRKCDSEPSLVKRLLREALGNDRDDHKLLVTAVHAVILESGFLPVDKVSGTAVDCSRLLDEWPSLASAISLRYSLPEILSNGSDATETVVLKFQNLGHLVNVYGSLSVGGSGLHRVCLDKYKFARALELMLAKSDSKDSTNTGDDHHEKEVFQLWKMVKDGLALPLLIDLCERAGLGSPPCFMRLPTELKLKILECLPGVDIAKVACLCSEMRYLSSNNDLWKQKFEEEFGQGNRGQGINSFKILFFQRWVTKKVSEQTVSSRSFRPRGFTYFRARRDPNPFGIPSIWGGDYDRLPGFGVPPPFRQLGFGGLPRAFQPRRRFSPACDLGGLNN